jgi:chemotaxis signal transduction protein
MDPFLVELQEHLLKNLTHQWGEFLATQPNDFIHSKQFPSQTRQFFLTTAEDFKKADLKEFESALNSVCQTLSEAQFYEGWLQRTEQERDELLKKIHDFFANWSAVETEALLKDQLKQESEVFTYFFKSTHKTKLASSLFLRAELNSDLFLLPMASVIEVSSRRAITPLPENDDRFLGLMTLRGDMIPVLSPHCIAENVKNIDHFSFLLICQLNGLSLAVPLSATDQIVSIRSEEIQDPSDHKGDKLLFQTTILENKIYRIIELEKLVA